MRNFLNISILFLVSTTFFTQAGAQSLTEKKVESIKSEVEAVFRDMLSYAERLDYDKLTSGVDDKHTAGFITNGKYYAGFSTLINEMKMNARGVSRQAISIREQKTTVLSDKIVLLTVSGTSKATLVDDREITAGFHWSFVYEKIDNTWKVIHSHQSTTL